MTSSAYDIGAAAVLLTKSAGAGDSPALSYGLKGKLYRAKGGWLLLSVPNALGRGAFQALNEPGTELPDAEEPGGYRAHISVMREEELATIGGADRVRERGKEFSFTLGPVRTVEPAGWPEISKCWFIEVHSPELERLRKSYGLSALPNDGRFKFHITFAIRRKGVLRKDGPAVRRACSTSLLIRLSDMVTKAATGSEKQAEAAPGIPDRGQKGELTNLRVGDLVTRVLQRHQARRAGPHYDYRLGTKPLGLFSWATKGEEPRPGEKRLLTRQPQHVFSWKDYQGTIPPKTYGAGFVEKVFEDKILVTKVLPDRIHFTTAERGDPERFVLFHPKDWKEDAWLIANVTPQDVLPYQKVRYTSVPAEQVAAIFDKLTPGASVQAKVDGASSLVKLLENGVEIVSYRASKRTGRPIVHTERVFGGRPKLDIPAPLVGTVLRGELYGQQQRDGDKVLAPQTLGGLLNATIAKSRAEQRAKKIQLRDMLFDIQQHGKQPIDFQKTPYAVRMEMLQSVLKAVPALAQGGQLHIAESATTPEESKALWQAVRSGRHPLTREGIVIHPAEGKPLKAKLVEEADVYVTGTFPGAGKYTDKGVGGFTYALTPSGATVGRVGTGLSDELRKELHNDLTTVAGRVARIRAQGQFASGAYRAPRLLALHEDYPQAKTAQERSQYLRAFSQTCQPQWSKGVWSGLKGYFQRWREQGAQNIRHARAARRMRAAVAAGRGAGAQDLARRDMLRYMYTGRRAVVNHPLDRFMETGQAPVGALLSGNWS